MLTAPPQHPKLRDDVVISPREGAGETAYVVNDPRSRRFFRLGEAEVFLARQLDGATPLEVVRKRAEEQFQTSLSDETLRRFVDSLKGLGLLEQPADAVQVPQPRPSRIRGNLFYLRWKAFDPDRLLGALYKKLRFFFTPAFVVLSAILFLLALGVAVVDWNMLGQRIPHLMRFDAFVLAWGVLIGVLVLHEFAHGLTCKHFGGQVHEMGFMLIFFQPAMYCNVSDAWMFPKKSQRLWVTFAGAWFEMFLWSVATLVWRLTDPATVLNFVSLMVMLTSGIKTIFNLNPLIKLDGYYLLSDWLDVPNLNWRSWGYVRHRIKCFLGLAESADGPKATPRERRIYWIYGTLSMGFVFLLMGWILTAFSDHLTRNYQATGFVVVATLVVLWFSRPIMRLLTKPLAWVTAARDPKRRWRGIKVGVAVVLLLALSLLAHMELTVSSPLTILPARYAEIRAEEEGIVDTVYVDESDRVEVGQPIAHLSDRAIRAELDKVNADIAAAGATLKMLEIGPRPEEVDLARRDVDTAQTKLLQARDEYETAKKMQTELQAKAGAAVEKSQAQLDAAREDRQRMETLRDQNVGSGKELYDAIALVAVREKELDEARASFRVMQANDLAELREDVTVAERELQTAESRLTLLLAGTRTETIEVTRANVARLETQRDYMERQIQSLEMVTPVAGIVTTPKLKDKLGQLVSKGDLIASVHDYSTVRAEIAVPEKEIADVAVGLPVVMKVRAFPGRRFEGTVVSIAPAATADEQGFVGKTILVTAEFDNASLALKPEMTGYAKIYCGKRTVFELITRRLVRYVRVEFWSWW